MEFTFHPVAAITTDLNKRWREFIAACDSATPYQSCEFADWANGVEDGLTVEGLVTGVTGRRLAFSALVLLDSRSSAPSLIVPHGPAASSVDALVDGAAFLTTMSVGRVCQIRIDPYFAYSDEAQQRLSALGYVDAGDRWSRLTVSIGVRDAAARGVNGLGRRARRAVRQASSAGVLVRVCQDDSGINEFVALHNQAARRKRHRPVNAAYVRRVAQSTAGKSPTDCGGSLFLARLANGLLCSGALVLWTPRVAWFQAGASSDRARPSGHLLHWSVIRELDDRGISTYDLAGIDATDQAAGVNTFKASFATSVGVRPLLGAQVWR